MPASSVVLVSLFLFHAFASRQARRKQIIQIVRLFGRHFFAGDWAATAGIRGSTLFLGCLFGGHLGLQRRRVIFVAFQRITALNIEKNKSERVNVVEE